MTQSQPEAAIEAMLAIPVVNGNVMTRVYWFKVEPYKVTICYADTSDHGKEKTEEFDIRGVTLSGLLATTRCEEAAHPPLTDCNK